MINFVGSKIKQSLIFDIVRVINCRCSNYQWYRNNKPIAGANKYYFTAVFDGDYFVKVDDVNGCIKNSDTVTIGSLGLKQMESEGTKVIKIYPNPTSGKVFIDASIDINIKVFDLNGKAILNGERATEIDISSIDDGIYYLKISDGSGNILGTKSIIKLTN